MNNENMNFIVKKNGIWEKMYTSGKCYIKPGYPASEAWGI